MGCSIPSLGLITNPLPMKTLLVFACMLLATAVTAAVPDYKAFRGTGGITIVSNPPNGTIVIDGSGISAGALPTYGITNNYAVGNTFTNLGTLRQSGNAVFLGNIDASGITTLNALVVQGAFQSTGGANSFAQDVTFLSGSSLELDNLLTNALLRVGAGGTVQTQALGANLSMSAAGVLSATTGSGTPGGSTTEVQYNDAGAFGANLQYVFTRASETPIVTVGSSTNPYSTTSGFQAMSNASTNMYAPAGIYSSRDRIIFSFDAGANPSLLQLISNARLRMNPGTSNTMDVGSYLLPFASNWVHHVYAKETVLTPNLTAQLEANLDGDIIISPAFAVVSSVLYASNGPVQMVPLVVNTNYTFAPLSGSDASNSVPIEVSFTQDSTGGRVVTLNAVTLDVDSLPNAITTIYVEVKNGATNVTAIVPVGRFHLATLIGTGTSLTNFTALADGKRMQYLNGGLTNINFAAIMRYQAAAHDNIVFVVTNLSADVCTMTLSAITNKWIPEGSLTAPFSITNALWLATSTRGTNVFYGAQYMANPAP